jgi:hypothetical protein
VIALLALFFALGGMATRLLVAAPAGANGPCGQDSDGNSACPVNSPGDYAGSLTTDNERDYYVFYAHNNTQLSVTVTNTEDPHCYVCGFANAILYDSGGNALKQAESVPQSGITVPATFDLTLNTTGTYYLVVTPLDWTGLGIGLGRDVNGNPIPTPYTLTVNASPAVQWPPPSLRCVVPTFSRNRTSLAAIKRRIRAGHCTVGHITHARSRTVRKGDVIQLNPRPHTRLVSGATVNVIILAGSK